MARISVVPAAEQPPDVADHELRLVVDGTEVRAVEERGGRPNRLDDLVERRALVHHPDRLGVEVLQERRGFGEGGDDPVVSEDRHSVAREQDLGVECCHRPQCPRPLDRVPLSLLGVAAVRGRPDEQVAGTQDSAGGRPEPDVVVGLAACVVAFDRLATRGQVVPRSEGLVGSAKVRGEGGAGQLELSLIDDAVVAGGLDVARETVGDRLVGDDTRRSPAVGLGGGFIELHPEAVIGVAVREDRGVQSDVAPVAQCLMHRRRCEPAAGVGEHEAVGGREGSDIREGCYEGGVGGHFDEFAVVGEEILASDRFGAGEEAVGEFQEIGHGWSLPPATGAGLLRGRTTRGAATGRPHRGGDQLGRGRCPFHGGRPIRS